MAAMVTLKKNENEIFKNIFKPFKTRNRIVFSTKKS